ncbi:TetR/AcrR family transcriptional regulator [Tardiphaga alba]|uniref:TetR/AcrR family transcriptional regulator n=1 Tax=Tardiphaga alba TaxID=340268 RepID=A0ABX8AEM3_9BRAD|nr:TetR/AcrR family transcriptional regulator [Tardiphaga alba]QUS41979.1 TetR/AcrR family transcriptional regulator [Tardiphaga alba]
MARTKEFDKAEALNAAVEVFREHGFAGSSAEMLTRAMGIGRQSLYDTFGDKWQLYCEAVRRYADAEREQHLQALNGSARAIDGIARMLDRVVADAKRACLGVSSISEFGCSRKELRDIHSAADRALRAAVVKKADEAYAQGDIRRDLASPDAAAFVLANLAAIRLAARGGASLAQLRSLSACVLQALK